MPSFLTLPRELRDEIINTLLDLPQPLVDPNLENAPRKPHREASDMLISDFQPHEVYNVCGLLLANRQLHDETNDILNRKKIKEMCYRVDAILTATPLARDTLASNPTYSSIFEPVPNKFKLRPTYTYIPVLATGVISTLDIVIHHDVCEGLFKYPLEDWLYTRAVERVFRAMDYLLYYLVEHCLKTCGASRCERFGINRLNIQIKLDTPRAIFSASIQDFQERWMTLEKFLVNWLRLRVHTLRSDFASHHWTVHEFCMVICLHFNDSNVEPGTRGTRRITSSEKRDEIINDMIKDLSDNVSLYEDSETCILWCSTEASTTLQ